MKRKIQHVRRLAKRLLAEGISPERMAMAIAVGLTLSLIPMAGAPTLCCTAAALLLRLNLPLVQAVNYLGTPLQLALLYPFIKIGSFATGRGLDMGTALTSSPDSITSPVLMVGEFFYAGLLGWIVTAPALFFFLYLAGRAACSRRAV